MFLGIIFYSVGFGLIFLGKGWDDVLIGMFLIAIGCVLLFEDLDGWATDWVAKHKDWLSDAQKTTSLRWRFATWLKGSSRVVYLYPGGRIGAPIAMVLTVGVMTFSAAVFVICMLTYLSRN